VRLNTLAPAVPAPRTHEGAIAARISDPLELRRTVSACMLWEDQFYESGVAIADRISALVATTDPQVVADLAIEARTKMKLRHVPLLLARELARRKVNIAELLPSIIQRPDELTEFLAIYWKDGKVPLAASVKRGLAKAFQRFDAYALAKYNRPDVIKLRDVLFLVHATPKDETQAVTWKQLAEGTLPTPDTWEVVLSGGADKLEAWTRLLTEKKLGALALLRNLRNMQEAKVPDALIRKALAETKVERVLPFRFISAARYAPQLEDALEAAMFRCLTDAPKLKGKTALVVDGSGSMFGTKISAKSELDRFDAAAALAILVREVCEDVNVYVFSHNCYATPPRRGFALRDVLYQSAERGGTNTQIALQAVGQQGYDRAIVITDEQSHQTIGKPLDGTKGYFINVASYKNGIGYGAWTHIDGWSEAVLDFIQTSEGLQD
jgi:60 kDa SS-A/Ro ribonucleoprotein